MNSHLVANISALGRVVPTSGVVDVWGPSGIEIDAIHVEQGQSVEKGELLATLKNKAQVEADVEKAKLALSKAEVAYSVESELQEVIISGLETDLVNATKLLKDSRKNKDILSPQVIEEREQAVSSTKNALARSKLIRKKILSLLAIEKQLAEANCKSAQSLFETSEIRAPIEGTVLIIRKQEGSLLGRGEFIKLADTSRMSVSAEVYESDISKVKPGQSVRVESVALAESISGKVTQVGHMLFRRSVDSLNPRSLSNSRVIEVMVDLDTPQAVKDLVYLQVDVFID
ncbi:MAG: HlyD family efflux transporter periplasmic adaptor subunit [Coraliomargaritaceae bacterium]